MVLANFLEVLPPQVAAALVYGAVNPAAINRLYHSNQGVSLLAQGLEGQSRVYAAGALLLVREPEQEEIVREMAKRDKKGAGNQVTGDLIAEIVQNWNGSRAGVKAGSKVVVEGQELILHSGLPNSQELVQEAVGHLFVLREIIEEVYKAPPT